MSTTIGRFYLLDGVWHNDSHPFICEVDFFNVDFFDNQNRDFCNWIQFVTNDSYALVHIITTSPSLIAFRTIEDMLTAKLQWSVFIHPYDNSRRT